MAAPRWPMTMAELLPPTPTSAASPATAASGSSSSLWAMATPAPWTCAAGRSKSEPTRASAFPSETRLTLSGNAAWQTVPTGTILTFTDKTTAQGGQDSGFALRDRRGTVGDVWSNIWMGDSTYLTYSDPAANGYSVSAGVVSGILIDHNATQFRVKNSAGQIVFGPAGEGVAPLRGTNSKEIFELEGHPTPSISPLVASTLRASAMTTEHRIRRSGFPTTGWMEPRPSPSDSMS